jgi:hypothetical protein
MLEITGDDIAALGDDDLRALVALLCEAEMRKRALPSTAVTWGGAQEAADGGVDVRVSLAAGTVIDGFVPRPACGFQVKKADMPASDIAGEMRPKGAIRPSIQDLADQNGAYIIVSGNGSTADEPLRRRREAMRGAVNDIPGGLSLAVDFYDRTRIATWLRDHPGLVPWVRAKAGRPIAGWQSYGPWANAGEGVAGEYLTDDAARIRTGTGDKDQGASAVEGIQRMRERLRQPRASARLVGLSGVGKTRLVQALFDDRVGANALDPALAIYTNLGDGPDPSPVAMVSALIATGSRAIAVIDNCPPDLHRRLTEIASATGSQVSVLTVEYDIREDQPEGTQVFEMEPSSLDITQKLVRKRFPAISQVDAQRIAEFSGGNGRMAIALAGTVERGENLSGLADEELFKRLFHQNHQPDPELLKAAEACSLVYSFDGENADDEGELARLGKLAGQDATALFPRVAELRRRDLVQARSIWRAVLPHAVANRLAKLALQNIPPKSVEKHLVTQAPDRIKRSFSRRLGYLHDSAEAQRIVAGWFGTGGILGGVAEMGELHAEMFANVAPVAPDAVLAVLERAAGGPKKDHLLAQRDKFVRLLRSLAYEPALFERCAELLAAFAVLDKDGSKSDAATALTSLFFIYLSGTHATIEQRLRVMEGLIKSDDPRRQALGLEALQHLLRTSHFTSSYDFQFGSRSRDHGYHPNFPQVQAWFAAVLRSAEAIGLSGLPVAAAVRRIVGQSFRSLWASAGVHDDLERVSRAWASQSYWRDGWIGARQTLNYDGKGMTADARRRLITLEQELRPPNLEQKVRSVVLSRTQGGVDLGEYEEDDPDPGKSHQRTEALAEKLGEEVAADEATLQALLPEVIVGSGKLVSFGAGLALGSNVPQTTWGSIVSAYVAAPSDKRGAQLLKGFLRKLVELDAALAGELLDKAVEDEVLGVSFPELQCSVPIDAKGVDRLRRSLALGVAPVGYFNCLAWGRSHEPIPAPDLKDLVELIGAKPDGNRVALEIIFFRLLSDRDAKRAHEPEIIEAGRAALAQLTFDKNDQREDHELGLVVTACLADAYGETAAETLCKSLKVVASAYETHIWHHHDLLQALCEVQPRVVLEALFGGDEKERRDSAQMLREFGDHRGNPLDAIPQAAMIAWCNQEPGSRYVTMASVVSYLRGSEEEAASQWSGVALTLLQRAPDPVGVARIFVERFRPASWSGSLAAILEGRKGLLTELEGRPDSRLAAFAREEGLRLASEIETERAWEAKRDRQTDERFE